MTDLERFLEFYKNIGIDLKPTNVPKDQNIRYILGKEVYVREIVNEHDKFDGYLGFYTEVEFTPEGKFICQGFWQ